MFADFQDIEILDDCDLPKDRDARMREAFERSKKSYPSEQKFTEIGHFRASSPSSSGHPDISFEDRPGSSNLAGNIPAAMTHIRRTEYILNDLYFRGLYRDALVLAMSELDREALNDDSKEGREQQIIDLGMRCAVRLEDSSTAVKLAEKATLKYQNIAGIMATSADAYRRSGQSRKALSAILRVISLRGPLPPFIRTLYEVLIEIGKEIKMSAKHDEGAASAFQEIIGLVEALLKPDTPSLRARSDHPSTLEASKTTAPPTVPEELVRGKTEMCGIPDFEVQILVRLLCRGDSTMKPLEEGRSVRGL